MLLPLLINLGMFDYDDSGVSNANKGQNKPLIKLREVEHREDTGEYIKRVLNERRERENPAPQIAIEFNKPLLEKPKSNEEAMKILIAIAELI